MPFVLDSSVTLAWLLPDESVVGVDPLFERLLMERAAAPAHWPLEVGNAVLTARRRNRITERALTRLLRDASALPVDIDLGVPDRWWSETISLAARHGLTTYDAAYLELAARQHCPLATLDAALATACKRAGVVVLP